MKKIKIYTWADKAPEMLYNQYYALKKFVKDEDWEFIVFNNVPFPKLDRQIKIKKICKELGIKCIDVRFRSFVSGAAQICAYGIHWAFHRFFRWQKNTIQVVLDSDMFPVEDMSFAELLGDNDIAAVYRECHNEENKIDYLWNALMIFDASKLPDKNKIDFHLSTVNGVRTDVAGKLYYWLQKNPQLKIKYLKLTDFSAETMKSMLPEKYRETYVNEWGCHFLESLLHYRAGSNWEKRDDAYVAKKKAFLNSLMEDILNDREKFNFNREKFDVNAVWK